jgi:peroxiredoxin
MQNIRLTVPGKQGRPVKAAHIFLYRMFKRYAVDKSQMKASMVHCIHQIGSHICYTQTRRYSGQAGNRKTAFATDAQQ